MEPRKIIHVDMDCFYAAVEMRDDPSLMGKPVIVGGRPDGRGVVTTASYEARKFGVRSAMPTRTAYSKCPHGIFIKPHFHKYKKESQIIREIFRSHTDLVEPLSLDEAYLDVTGSEECEGSATLLAKKIRDEIFEATKLTASAGIAPNKFLAKVASDWKKPNGQFTVAPNHVKEFVRRLKVNKIPGVGRVTAGKMNAMDIYTCADLQKFDRAELVAKFGKWGHRLYGICRGVDHRPVSTGGERKSLSVESTYGEDLPSLDVCLTKIPRLYEEFDRRLLKAQIPPEKIKGLFVKVKFHDFQTTTFESSEVQVPSLESYQKFIELAYNRQKRPVRLLGLGVRLMSSDKGEKEDSPQMVFEI